jgi:hypothetical protein
MFTDIETTGRTVVFQKEGRIIPIDHLVDTRLEKGKKLPVGKRESYIGPPEATR